MVVKGLYNKFEGRICVKKCPFASGEVDFPYTIILIIFAYKCLRGVTSMRKIKKKITGKCMENSNYDWTQLHLVMRILAKPM